MLTVVPDPAQTAASRSVLDELVREGARRTLAAAVEAEVAAYIQGTKLRSMSAAGGWSPVTGMPRRGR